MKKLSRNQKNRIYEKIKTLILILLIISGLFLGYHVFKSYDSKATADTDEWGAFFSPLNDGTGQSTEEELLTLFRKWSAPELVVATAPHGKFEITEENDLGIISDEAFSAIHRAYGKGQSSISYISSLDWNNALEKSALYLRFPEMRLTAFEASFSRNASSPLAASISDYTELILLPDTQSQLSLLFRGENRSKLLKIEAEETSPALDSIISKYSQKADPTLHFAYELGFNSDFIGSNVNTDSMLLITNKEIKTDDIIIDISRTYKAAFDFANSSDFLTGLVRIFGYNPNTVRQYVNNDNALTFVGETGTLRIFPGGKIEYKSLGTNEGIQLRSSARSEAYSASLRICEIANNILEINGSPLRNRDFEIKLTKTPKSFNSEEKAEICFDYFVDGKQINFGDNAVSAIIEDGKLTEFKMHIKSVKRLNSRTTASNILEAVDKFCTDNPSSKNISHGSLVYKYTGNDKPIKAEWQIRGE